MTIWKAIPGHCGYEASDEGKIRSVDRQVKSKNGVVKNLKGRVLKPGVHSTEHPYPFVQLGKGKGKGFCIHRLVAWTFIGPQTPGIEVRHKDGDCTNCWLINLEYGTPTQNQQDRKTHGTFAEGENHGGAKLTEADVLAIRKRLATGELQRVIAADYDLKQPTLSNIKNRKLWKHLP